MIDILKNCSTLLVELCACAIVAVQGTANVCGLEHDFSYTKEVRLTGNRGGWNLLLKVYNTKRLV
jgi:hypothetical protein